MHAAALSPLSDPSRSPGHPPQTGTGTLTLFLSDVNDNAPTLHPRSQYLEVCESSGPEPLLIEAEDRDLEPYSDPFTFELDPTQGAAGDTWKLGENRGECVRARDQGRKRKT